MAPADPSGAGAADDWTAGLQDGRAVVDIFAANKVEEDEPVIEEVAYAQTRNYETVDQPGDEDGLGGFGDFADFNEAPAEQQNEANEEANEETNGEPNDGDQEQSFGAFEEAEAAKPAVPKKPLTENDLLSGFMSEFGSSLQKKVGQVNLNKSTSQGDSSAVENKSNADENDLSEALQAAAAPGKKVFAYEPAQSLQERSEVLLNQIKAFFEESESVAKNLTALKEKVEREINEDRKAFFKNVADNLAEYRPYLSSLKDSQVAQVIEEFISIESQKAPIKKQMREHVEAEEFEEAAQCKKQIRSLEARQQEIEEKVVASVQDGALEAEAEDDTNALKPKDLLKSILSWE